VRAQANVVAERFFGIVSREPLDYILVLRLWVPETMHTGPDLLLRRRPATGMIRGWRSA